MIKTDGYLVPIVNEKFKGSVVSDRGPDPAAGSGDLARTHPTGWPLTWDLGEREFQ